MEGESFLSGWVVNAQLQRVKGDSRRESTVASVFAVSQDGMFA